MIYPPLYKREEGYYVASFSAGGLIIAAVEESYDEMVKDFKYQISDAWDYYACENDEKLSEGAKQVKKWLLENVQEI